VGGSRCAHFILRSTFGARDSGGRVQEPFFNMLLPSNCRLGPIEGNQPLGLSSQLVPLRRRYLGCGTRASSERSFCRPRLPTLLWRAHHHAFDGHGAGGDGGPAIHWGCGGRRMPSGVVSLLSRLTFSEWRRRWWPQPLTTLSKAACVWLSPCTPPRRRRRHRWPLTRARGKAFLRRLR